MDLVELLKSIDASLKDLAETDGFKSFTEANSKVLAAREPLTKAITDLPVILAKMAGEQAKALADETVKKEMEGYVSKADHEKALAEAKDAQAAAVEEAKKSWETEQAEKDRIATVLSERLAKVKDAKVESIPDRLKTAIAEISANEDGDKAFTDMLSRLETRRKACADASVKEDINILNRILCTLPDDDAVFNAELDVWKSLVAQATAVASDDLKDKRTHTIIPRQPASHDGKEELLGAC